MRRILALGIVVLTSVLSQPPALAAEGPVSELQAQPLDPKRVSKYTETRGAAAADSAEIHEIAQPACREQDGRR